jgi:transcriptional regulator with XRE-family HTH domain
MQTRRATTKSQSTERLGPVLHRLRTERRIQASELSKETGLSRSYLSHLESGHFSEIGVKKFARLIQALKVDADQVLAEAGFLSAHPKAAKLPDPETYLRLRYKLPADKLALATDFLEMLSRQERRRPKAEAERGRN